MNDGRFTHLWAGIADNGSEQTESIYMFCSLQSWLFYYNTANAQIALAYNNNNKSAHEGIMM